MEDIQTFCNLLWANLPKNFTLSFSHKEKTIKIFVTKENVKNKRKSKKTKTYSHTMIYERKDDLWGLSRDCAEEIKSDF